MPYEIEWIPNELLLEHKGVCVYHVYANDEAGCRREYWYATNPDARDEDGADQGVFDVRDLDTYDGSIRIAIVAAIESGELKQGDE
ncbi:MAG: hypothetical protein GY759_09060 [Chloroflexi bacterium]|nr:hypothetical protein [Chloroflexota bacterium]